MSMALTNEEAEGTVQGEHTRNGVVQGAHGKTRIQAVKTMFKLKKLEPLDYSNTHSPRESKNMCG